MTLQEPALRDPFGPPPPPPMPERPRSWSGGYDQNVHSSPTSCGFDLVASLEDVEPYQFDITLLLRDHASGRFYVVHDSGCSCPSPFEDVTDMSDLTLVRTEQEVGDFIKSKMSSSIPASDVLDFMRKVRDVL